MTRKMKSPAAVILISMLLLVCGYSLCYNIISITMNPIIDVYSLTGSSQGLMSSMINLGSILPLFVIPFFQGRVHKVWQIVFCCAVLAAAVLLSGTSRAFPLLLAGCLFLGAAYNSLDTLVNAYLVGLYPDNIPRSLSLVHAMFGVGGLLAPALLTPVLKKWGWRMAYFSPAALFVLIAALFCLLTLPRFRSLPQEQAAKEIRLTLPMVKSYLSKPRNILLVLAGGLCCASQLGLVNWAVRYEAVRFNAPDTGSLCVSAYWICCTLCRLTAPNLRVKPIVIAAGGSVLGGLFHAAGVLSGSPVLMVIASGLIGLVSGAVLPVILAEAAYGNENMASLTTSSIFLSKAAFRMVMPLFMGAMAAASITGAMLLPAVTSLLAGGACLWADRCRKRAG